MWGTQHGFLIRCVVDNESEVILFKACEKTNIKGFLVSRGLLHAEHKNAEHKKKNFVPNIYNKQIRNENLFLENPLLVHMHLGII